MKEKEIYDTLVCLCIKYRDVLEVEPAWNIDTLLGVVYESLRIKGARYVVTPKKKGKRVVEPYSSGYVADEIKDEDYEKRLRLLLGELEVLKEKLSDMGVSLYDAVRMIPTEHKVSRLVVGYDGVLLFPDYGVRIGLTPLQAALYLLVLKNKEGILIKSLPDYAEELENILERVYSMRGKTVSQKHTKDSIARITDITSGSVNENISRIKRTLTEALGSDIIARNYYINSLRCHRMHIPLSMELSLCLETVQVKNVSDT